VPDRAARPEGLHDEGRVPARLVLRPRPREPEPGVGSGMRLASGRDGARLWAGSPYMTVAIPEHTVDVWVAILVAQAFPSALIWAPTQMSSPDFDLAVGMRPGKLFILENKAPTDSATNGADFEIRINPAQLDRYLATADLADRTFYVLPCPKMPPAALRSPNLIPPAALLRPTAGRAFRVIAAQDLWASLWPHVPRRPSSRVSPIPPSRRVDPCACVSLPRSSRYPLARTFELQQFLDLVRECTFFDDLYWRGDVGDEVAIRLATDRLDGPFSPTTLAVLIEQDPGGTIFPNWPSR